MKLTKHRRKEARFTRQSGLKVSDVLKDDGNQRSKIPGDYFGRMLKNVPIEYLEWVVGNVSALEFRDVAEIELWRRNKQKTNG